MSHPLPETNLFRLPFFISLGLWLALGAGCSSEPRPERSGGPAGPTADYPTVMSGIEGFSDGKIVVEVTLGLPTDFRPGKDGSRRGGGSHSGQHGGRRSGGMSAGGYSGSDANGNSNGSDDDGPRSNVTGSTLPPAQLKIHLRNASTTDSVACEIVDFNSSLGNFAVYPSRYQIEPGQAASSEIMTSRLGVEGSDIPVTVAIRVRDQVEKKVITLHLLPVADKPAGQVPPAGN